MRRIKEGGGLYFGNVASLYAGFGGPDGDGLIGRASQDPPPKATPVPQPQKSIATARRVGGIDPTYIVVFCSIFDANNVRTNRSRIDGRSNLSHQTRRKEMSGNRTRVLAASSIEHTCGFYMNAEFPAYFDHLELVNFTDSTF